eukprot:12470930-Prorocentrum_lima.AAC.1
MVRANIDFCIHVDIPDVISPAVWRDDIIKSFKISACKRRVNSGTGFAESIKQLRGFLKKGIHGQQMVANQ